MATKQSVAKACELDTQWLHSPASIVLISIKNTETERMQDVVLGFHAHETMQQDFPHVTELYVKVCHQYALCLRHAQTKQRMAQPVIVLILANTSALALLICMNASNAPLSRAKLMTLSSKSNMQCWSHYIQCGGE